MILPEFGVALNRNHYACWGADHLMDALPRACPACGAKLKPKYANMKYVCGAKYEEKPQGQTHTAVFWGTCPARAEPYECEKAKLAPNTPPGIVADRLEELGFTEDAEHVRKSCNV
jgi:hypothetical protein